jgi:uncharacterized protein (TIGR03118 family)
MKSILLSALVTGAALAAASCSATDPETQIASDDQDLHSGHKRHKRTPVVEALQQTNIVSDQKGVAEATDPNLVNAWGLAFNPIGVAWVSSAGKGLSQVYNEEGEVLLSVTIPPAPGAQPPSSPTGQVFNGTDGAFLNDRFIFVTEQGTVAGWQPSLESTAALRANNAGIEAIYKGVAIAKAGEELRLYATDFHNARVDVFDSKYQPLGSCQGFLDDQIPTGFAPFNIFTYQNLLFVSYAKQDADKEDDVAGAGNGFLDVFDPDGRLVERLISGGALNSPWGMAVAPSNFGRASNRLLVGNFGDGRINVYNLTIDGTNLHAAFEGVMGDARRRPLVIEGLWALVFGPDAGGFDADEIYFTAGPDDEQHGLFGELALASESDAKKKHHKAH